MTLDARTVLITGASSGLGLEYVRQLVSLDKAPEIVIATCRCPETAVELQSLAKFNPNVKILKLNVEDDEDLEVAFQVSVY
ncbi:unnamed protein product [Lymnaea stagnalis]|uniref:Ketoreductase (KR) domain-containing protein n=1 Tax=Lymnaea stagnalis TaxID=6523 RepID=A0AAV2I4F5_LYMST